MLSGGVKDERLERGTEGGVIPAVLHRNRLTVVRKVEERLGFEQALQIDEAVWKVLPKIQARALKAMMNLPSGLAGLEQALSARLSLEGFEFDIMRQEGAVEVAVSACPWHQIMIKSGRAALSERVSEVICRVENETWASEFSEKNGEKIDFEWQARLCRGDGVCRLLFVSRSG